MCSVLHIFCNRSRWLPVLSLSLRTFQRWKYGCPASRSAVSRLEISSCFSCLKTFMLLALLTPFSRPSAHDWILCSWCDIMDGAEMEEAPVSHAALSLWAVVWDWPEVLLCVAGALWGFSPLHCSGEHEEATLTCCDALCFSKFAFILPGPACCLLIQHCLLPKERWSSPKSDSLLEWQHDAPHPFYLLCLSCVCTEPASSLDPQGRVCSSSSLRLVQE